jgi:chromate transporter
VQGVLDGGLAVAAIGGALYFAVNTMFARTITVDRDPWRCTYLPDLATLRPVPLASGVLAAVLLFAMRWPVLRVLEVCAALGLAAGFAGLPVA